MTNGRRIYLDHAATSWPRHDACLQAMDKAARTTGAAGRGAYQSAAKAQSHIDHVRRELASLINAESPDCISLHTSGTTALNAMIHGLVAAGDHVVTTAADHNSVLRPLDYLSNCSHIELTVVDCDQTGRVAEQDVVNAVRDDTALVVMTHASNVTGAVQPIAQVANALAEHAAMFAVDAAQTCGCLPINVSASKIDLLAAPGHKSAGGPLGTGFLFVTPDLHERISPTIQGGTGSVSESLEMPTRYPDKLEAGNINVPAMAGWTAGLQAIKETGVASIAKHLAELSRQLHEGLGRIDGVRLFSESGELAIASFQMEGASPSDLAAILDAEFGVEARSGLHCAALIHKFIQSGLDGTLRLSGGHATTRDEIQTAVDAVDNIANQLRQHGR